MAIDIVKQGSKAKVTISSSATFPLYPNLSDLSLGYNSVALTVDVSFITKTGNYSYPNQPQSTVTLNGVVITSQAVFDTQLTALTPLSEPSTGGVSGSVSINDGISSGLKATVAQFHNGDNQTIPGTAYGILTGGVAQLVNAQGNTDRQRGTGIDGIAAVGISTGAAQNAQPFSTNHTTSTVIGASTVFTPVAMSGFTSGAPWSIQVGSVVVLEPIPVNGPVPANTEAVVVTAVTATTFTAKTTKAHTGPFSILGFVYNQSRDATAADGASGQGYGAAGTYLFNQILNAGAGGWERERSAAGELDGATGVGTAVAAEYEWNGGGPGGGNYDRARNLQAKLKNSGTVSAAQLAGVSTFVISSATGLGAGEQVIIDRGTANQEALYTTATYTAGSTTLAFTSNTVFAHSAGATVEWDDFASNGPQLAGFLATGIGIEEECVYDPVTNLNYIERSASQDAMPVQNIVAESPALFNGSSMDRQRSNIDTGSLQTLTAASSGSNGADQINVNGRGVKVVINVTAITGTTPSLTVTMQGKDTASGVYYNQLVSAAITAVGTTVLTLYPGLTGAANVTANDILPRTWRVISAIAGTTPAVTATIGSSVII